MRSRTASVSSRTCTSVLQKEQQRKGPWCEAAAPSAASGASTAVRQRHASPELGVLQPQEAQLLGRLGVRLFQAGCGLPLPLPVAVLGSLVDLARGHKFHSMVCGRWFARLGCYQSHTRTRLLTSFLRCSASEASETSG